MSSGSDIFDRRRLLQTGAASLTAIALTQPGHSSVPHEVETLALWPGAAPGGTTAGLKLVVERRSPDVTVYSQIVSPCLFVYRPRTSNGVAIVLMQGGGYVHIANGSSVPAAFSALGFTVFDLIYRLPGEGWKVGPDAPKQDGQRAVRLVRKLAAKYAINPDRIGVMGYSAGGHVAGMAATCFDQKVYAPVDDADQLSARPDFAILSCPVLTMLAPFAHKGSRHLLLGDAADVARQEAYSVEKLVTNNTPPSFLVHADDDKTVPAENSILYAMAMRRAGVPVELHMYTEGGHGMGPNLPPNLPASHWPEAMLRWFDRELAPPSKT